jgi:ABC-2 type transport system permease protein
MIRVLSDWVKRSNKVERIWLLAKIEFKLRYYENKLGLLWALIKPVMDMCIYYVAFKIVLKNDVPAFASYLFAGLIIWNFFIESTSGTIQVLSTKKYLYEYSNMNKLEIYISTLFSNTIGFFFNTCIFLLVYNFLEPESHGSSWYTLWIIPLYLNLFVLSLGFSLILSNLFVIAKDINQIWLVFTSFLFFLSPIFFKLDVFRSTLPSFDYFNPVAGIIINARKAIMEGTHPDFDLFIFDIGYACFFLLLGIVLLNKLGSKAAEKL